MGIDDNLEMRPFFEGHSGTFWDIAGCQRQSEPRFPRDHVHMVEHVFLAVKLGVVGERGKTGTILVV